MAVAALLIWLEDRGPVFYSSAAQWLAGASIHRAEAAHYDGTTNAGHAEWTQVGDQRITAVEVNSAPFAPR